jgi:hypothetical protein
VVLHSYGKEKFTNIFKVNVEENKINQEKKVEKEDLCDLYRSHSTSSIL